MGRITGTEDTHARGNTLVWVSVGVVLVGAVAICTVAALAVHKTKAKPTATPTHVVTPSEAAPRKTVAKTQPSTSSIDTSTWRSVTNTATHVSFKYPQDDTKRVWHYFASNTAGTQDIGVQAGVAKTPNNFPVTVFDVKVGPVGSSIDNIIGQDKIAAYEASHPGLVVTASTVTKNGVGGTCYDEQYAKTPAQNAMVCRFAKNGTVYIFDIENYTTTANETLFANTGTDTLEAIGKQIFSTFVIP